MGYAERTLRITFDELGEGAFVVIRNPLLEPLDESDLDADTSTQKRAAELTRRKLIRLIVQWRMWDVESGDELALPSEDAGVLDRCPSYVWTKLGTVIRDSTLPPQ